ncbi:hypothetical protein [Pseudarthrobacter sp. S9]|uniref:hypothetical protein n=1 Tax=Pseudarthrobacter sp. S9 TaxID=3418421 RepID=UPI003D012CB9
MGWEAAAGVVGGVLLVYAVLLLLLWGYARRHPDTVTMKDALRLLPSSGTRTTSSLWPW